MNLPPDAQLNIDALANLFDDTTTSYKYLWMLGILQIVEEAGGPVLAEGSAEGFSIPVRHIFACMLKKAEPPLHSFLLHLGHADRMDRHIQEVRDTLKDSAFSFEALQPEQIPSKVVTAMKRFVPQQTLAPFFSRESGKRLSNDADVRGREIREVAAQAYDSKEPPLYKINRHDIELHPLWTEYLWRNRAIVKDWILYRWIKYLQARNPNTPNILDKISESFDRGSLGKQREWWREAMRREPVRCIYSKQMLRFDDPFELDHYVPWSFVGHNQIWNLVPVSPEANSRKSDNLPDSSYAKPFVALQHRVLQINKPLLHNGFRDFAKDYATGLKIKTPPLPSKKRIQTAYQRVIEPMLTLAEHQGFSPRWRYKLPR